MEMVMAAVAAAADEAFKVWSFYALLLGWLGISLSLSERRGRTKDTEIREKDALIKSLWAEVSRLQDLRLQDAREMIRIAESGTATLVARRDLMRDLADQFAQLKESVPPQLAPEAPR